MKDKEEILKAAREKKPVTYKGTPIRLSADFSAETLQARREWHDILSDERKKAPTKNTLPSKALTQILRRNQKLSRQAKAKRIQRH